MQSSNSLMNGPSLSPRGQAVGPPGIQRSEAVYGSPTSRANISSPTRPHHSFPTSSPPRFQSYTASPFSNSMSFPRQNGSPFTGPNPFQSNLNPSYNSSFSRPTSATGTPAAHHSPVKHSSPRPVNGVPNAYNFSNSPHSSFPPSSVQAPVFSPTKHSSPPPSIRHMSSPAPAPVNFVPSPSQMPARVLPDPIPAPSKHDGERPTSSHEISEKPIFPPIKSLSPSVPPQDLSPPLKKSSPVTERSLPTSFNGNGFGSSQ